MNYYRLRPERVPECSAQTGLPVACFDQDDFFCEQQCNITGGYYIGDIRFCISFHFSDFLALNFGYQEKKCPGECINWERCFEDEFAENICKTLARRWYNVTFGEAEVKEVA